MKIAMISEGWTPVFGGGQVHVDQLCRGLVLQHDASIDLFVRKLHDDEGCVFDQDESLLEDRWKIIRTGYTAHFFNRFARIWWLVSFTCFLLWKTYQEKYDLIHAHALLPGLPAVLVGWICHVPVVYTVHGTMHLDVPRKNIYYYIEKLLVTRLRYNAEISVSHEIFRYANRNTNIVVIPNGVDIAAYDSVVVPEQYLGKSFLTVARIDRQKNHLCMLEAINMLDRELLDRVGFHWNIVGDGPLRQELEDKIAAYGLGHYVTVKGKLFGNELIEEYKKNRVFILPSLGEGQPLTILEAFASKLPVVATTVGDNSFFVQEKVTGFLIEAGNRVALKESIERVCSLSDEEIAEMGSAGYTFVQEYDRWQVVKRTYAVYESLV